MTDTIQFSEAAELYAKNGELIDTMRGEFTSAMTAFLGSLKNAMEKELDAELEVFKSENKVHWWLAESGKERQGAANLIVKLGRYDAIGRGELVVTGAAPKGRDDDVERYAAVLGPLRLENVRSGPPKRMRLFSVRFGCSPGTKYADLARPMARLLEALDAVE